MIVRPLNKCWKGYNALSNFEATHDIGKAAQLICMAIDQELVRLKWINCRFLS